MKNLFSVAILAALSAAPASAITSRVGSSGDFGLGATLGQPLGATGKYWLSSTTAVDGFAGYHFNNNFDLHADYLWHSFSSFEVQQGRLPFYFGLGARINAGDDTHFGMRIPLGASYLPSSEPYEFFVEVAPVVKMLSHVGLDVDGLVGFRIYLNYTK